eukprot:398669_1
MGECISTQTVKCKATKSSDTKPNEDFVDGKRIFYDKEADQLINAYIHFGGNVSNLEFYSVYIPRDILWLISTYHLRSMTVETSTICLLHSGMKYDFDEFTLKPWSVLSVNGYNINTKEGGILFLKCDTLNIEKCASINLNGKGFINDSQLLLQRSNKLLSESHNLFIGKGNEKDGRGGGCIYIECDNFIMNRGNIMACGHKGYTNNTKHLCGYGGLIHIIIHKYVAIGDGYGKYNSKILAIGFAKRNDEEYYGKIIIESSKKIKNQFETFTNIIGNSVQFSETFNTLYHAPLHPPPTYKLM